MAMHIEEKDRKVEIKDGAKLYAELRRDVTEAGLLKRRYGYYAFIIILTVFYYVLGIYGIVRSQSFLSIILWSIFFGSITIHFGGLVHDAGHRAIVKTVFWNDVIGYISGTLIAFGYSEWRPKHDQHHAHTNQTDEDPDLEVPLLYFTKERIQKQKGILRFLAKYQAYFYFLLGSLAGYTMRFAMITYLWKKRSKKIIPDAVIFGLSYICWYALPFIFFPFGKAITVFFVVNLVNGLYMMHIFAPNHKGMPEIAKGAKLSFLEQQIMTSRNINPHWLTDYIFMGLNYQIEHHLFPSCPRINLRKLTPFVKKLAKQLDLEYTTVSIFESDKIILRELYSVSQTLS